MQADRDTTEDVNQKVVQQLPEAIGGVAALRAAAGGKEPREPPYPAVLEMVEALAEECAAVQGAHATVAMMATGFNGIEEVPVT